MNSQKVENQLNLALDISNQDREKTLDLDVGFDQETKRWELIVRYNTELAKVAAQVGFTYVELLANYAIIRIDEDKIDQLANYSEIEYIEKPKKLFFEVGAARQAACVPPVEVAPFSLTGRDVIVAVIDSGIDYSHPDFRNDDGTTRIIALWDQTIAPQEGEGPPEGFVEGTLYTRERINEAIAQSTQQARYNLVPSTDVSGHGTHVAGIAAGNGRASSGKYRGLASQSELLVVKLGRPLSNSFPSTVQLMTGIDFVIRNAIAIGRPVAINLSFGNNYGSHDGRSILENYLDEAAAVWKNCIIVGTGNEGASKTHTAGVLTEGADTTIELVVGEGITGLNMQIWKNYYDKFDVSLIHPSGNIVGPIQEVLGTQSFLLNETRVFLYFGEPQPLNRAQEIYFEFLPTRDFLSTGVWKFVLTPRKIVAGNYDFWLPATSVIGNQTGFLRPVPETTLTIPSTSRQVISVGAYNSNNDSFAAFSGRGYTRGDMLIKPDLAAPGVNIISSAPGGGYSAVTGTSFATPFVTGACALLMEWGIVKNNDPYLYGEKMKSYLINGARTINVFKTYPNPEIGWGVLCVRDSIPR